MSEIIFFKKARHKKEKLNLHSVSKGNLIEISKIEDDVFSKKMLGDGFAIRPITGEIYSPIEGKVVSIFPTKHAIGLKTSNDIEILIHIGIDTVELKGEPFEIFVQEGDLVSSSTLLATVNLNQLEINNKKNDIIVIITQNNNFHLKITNYGTVEENELIGYLA